MRGSISARAYSRALRKITGVEIQKTLPTPNFNLNKIPECQKYLDEGSHRRLSWVSPNDYNEMKGIGGAGERAQPGEPEVVVGHPEDEWFHDLTYNTPAFSPNYSPNRSMLDRVETAEKSR